MTCVLGLISNAACVKTLEAFSRLFHECEAAIYLSVKNECTDSIKIGFKIFLMLSYMKKSTTRLTPKPEIIEPRFCAPKSFGIVVHYSKRFLCDAQETIPPLAVDERVLFYSRDALSQFNLFSLPPITPEFHSGGSTSLPFYAR